MCSLSVGVIFECNMLVLTMMMTETTTMDIEARRVEKRKWKWKWVKWEIIMESNRIYQTMSSGCGCGCGDATTIVSTVLALNLHFQLHHVVCNTWIHFKHVYSLVQFILHCSFFLIFHRGLCEFPLKKISFLSVRIFLFCTFVLQTNVDDFQHNRDPKRIKKRKTYSIKQQSNPTQPSIQPSTDSCTKERKLSKHSRTHEVCILYTKWNNWEMRQNTFNVETLHGPNDWTHRNQSPS